MTPAERIATLQAELRDELVNRILPYWTENTVDAVNGGFVGRITQEGVLVSNAPKGAVLNARILWTFSAVCRHLGKQHYLEMADRAHRYLRQHFWDGEFGGVFWSTDATGRPLDTAKRIYAQAFVIYALSEKFMATSDSTALNQAVDLFRMVEKHGFDPDHGGYLETFGREWERIEDMRLSDTDDNAPKSMNTQLHVLEAYTNLYRCWPSRILHDRLIGLVRAFLDHMYDPQAGQMRLFFEADWTPRSSTFSYGHDIEAAWLLLRAVDVMGEKALRGKILDVAITLANATERRGQDEDGGIYWTGNANGPVDTDKHWWPQAEAIVGFLTVFRETSDQRYLDAAVRAWNFVQERLLDREHGEWFSRVTREGVPYDGDDKVGLWKCPYHNVRACLEVIATPRLKTDQSGR